MVPPVETIREPRTLPLADRLREFGDATALIAPERSDPVSYGELASLVEARAAELPVRRSLIELAGGNGLEFVITYLAARHGGHVVHLAGRDLAGSFCEVYRPGVAVESAATGVTIVDLDPPTTHALHPDLALLLSTSGTTGSTKTVRLSAENLDANAAAIAHALDLRSTDRAITSLPLHYCYGLSVLNSHLAIGASVVLTDLSVVDPCFWEIVRTHEVTNLSGVPHTFELLDRVPHQLADAPTLRFLTQAGGKMAAADVTRHASAARSHGRDLYIMYGQTEATARITVLPPDLVIDHPDAAGIAVPGGTLEIRPGPGDPPDVGEVVYRGPNVMLGYASGPADLARGRDIDELCTGDIGRLDDGLLTIVGRRSRFVKPFGLRVDLDRIEADLRADGLDAVVTGDDSGVVVGLTTSDAPSSVVERAASRSGLPRSAVEVVRFDEWPRLSSGKLDRSTILREARGAGRAVHPSGDDSSVASIYASVLGRGAVTGDDTFAGLGGDSMSYVEVSIRLESALGDVPPDWHLRRVTELEERRRPVAGVARVESNVVLRAVAIVLIVTTHMGLATLGGGAHVLLAVAGWNFARFQLDRMRSPTSSTRRWVGSSLSSTARIAVPSAAWIAANMAVVGGYSLGAVLLVNNYVGSSWRRDGRWQYWYVEVIVQILVVATIVFAIPAVRRLERRVPFLFALALVIPALVLRWEIVQLGDPYNYLFRTHTVVWAFLLGWLAYRAATVPQRLLTTVLAAVAALGFFDDGGRDLRVAAGIAVLIWVPTIPLPRPLNRVVGLLAGASLYIYLVHWQVFPVAERLFWPVPALIATLAVGVLVWLMVDSVSRRLGSVRSR